jgi:fumarate reductase iron-sulfur subunit
MSDEHECGGAKPCDGTGTGTCGSECRSAAAEPAAAASQVLGTITLQVQRYRPDQDEAPYLQAYTVPWGQDTSVLDALTWVKDNLDPSLTFRWSCRMAICGSCGFMLNGEPRLGCEHFVRDYVPGPLRIEPLENFAVERDLVVDLEPFMAKLAAVKPYLIPEAGGSLDGPGNLQTPEQMLAYHDFAMCINCLLCYSACPQVGLAADFLGPAAVTAAVRYNKDSRDFGEDDRLPVLDSEVGLWSCTFVGACSTVCPKGVDPAAAIQQAKAATAKAWAFEFVLPHHGADR